MHANAACDVPARLEALGSTAGLGRAALHSQLAAALSVVVHLARDRAGQRRVAEIHVLERDGGGLVGSMFHKSLGMSKDDLQRIGSRLATISGAGSLSINCGAAFVTATDSHCSSSTAGSSSASRVHNWIN